MRATLRPSDHSADRVHDALAPREAPPLPSATFTLSLDFELMWGTVDRPNWRRYRESALKTRTQVIGPLLDLLDEFGIQASWCTVGHLMLDRCDAGDALHQPIVDAGRKRDPREVRDPHSCESLDPAFYGRQLIERIRACPTPQEIGSHSFTHTLFGGRGCTRQIAEAELASCRAAAAQLGLELRSFVFPRNAAGYLDLLPQYGFRIFRGQDPVWYQQNNGTRPWTHRLGHLYDVATVAAPPAVLPIWNPAGLWELPGSMLYTPAHGIRRAIPVAARVARAKKGIEAAVGSRRVFHLWFHPEDLAARTEAMLEGLRKIFQQVDRLRSRKHMTVMSLGEMATWLDGPVATAGARLADHRTV